MICAISESDRQQGVRTPAECAGMIDLHSIVRGNDHYIHGPNPELFDLVKDPYEKNNLLTKKLTAAQKAKLDSLDLQLDDLLATR